MEYRNLVRPTLFIAFTICSLISCNYIFENSNIENKLAKERISRIQASKEEARLLVKASKTNLEILELCKGIQNTNTKSAAKDLAKNLEKMHIEISRNYNELALKKLISVPNYSNLAPYAADSIAKNFSVERNLKLILNKINNQLKLLDSLNRIANNTEYKVLVIRDSFKLKSSKNKIEDLLSDLKEST